MLQKMDDRQTDRLSAKIPSWAGAKLVIPSSLALEQCSSEATARHKAAVAASFLPGMAGESRIADLTGGLGVDCWAFGRVFGKVLYNEMNPVLAGAVKSNFDILGAGNVEFSNEEVSAASLCGDLGARLEEFGADVIYLDPARRGKTGGKVFLPEDCNPDITAILPRLLELCPTVLVKLSPVMDISLLARKLPQAEDIRVIGAAGECKELLCVFGREAVDGYDVIAEELDADGSVCASALRSLSRQDGDAIPAVSYAGAGDLSPGMCLYVPSATALKADCHGQLALDSGLKKLDRFTQVYVGEETDGGGFFKRYAILETMPLSNSTLRQAAALYPGADVTARNIPLSSEQLRDKLYGKAPAQSGRECHIFGVSTAACGRMLIITERI